MGVTFRVEGFRELDRALGQLPKQATGRAVIRRTLKRAAEPVAAAAAAGAPHEQGKLSFSIAVATQLTRRHRAEARVNEVEVYIGPAGGLGALYYATFQEFGTVNMPAHPFMRPAWDANKAQTLELIKTVLGIEIERTASRLARRAGR